MDNALTEAEEGCFNPLKGQNSVNSCHILTTRLDYTSYDDACDRIQKLAEIKQSSYVVAANVHVVMTAYWNAVYRKILNRAALVTPDGVPLMLWMRWIGSCSQSRVYGPDLMLAMCNRAAKCNLAIYLYGSTPKTIHLLTERLQKTFPQLKIAGQHSPPFRPLSATEEETDLKRIRQSGASIVFVGLGCPKQEEWMYRQVDKLDAVMIGVGAAFQFHSGEVSQAPRLMMKLSLEWLFRLYKEPRRLWRRYLLTNPAFLYLFLRQLAFHHARRVTMHLKKFRILVE